MTFGKKFKENVRTDGLGSNFAELEIKSTSRDVHLVTKKVEQGKFYDQMWISGLQCVVEACVQHENIKGSVSCSVSLKNFKFDFATIFNSQYEPVDIKKELGRIFFDISLKTDGTD